MSYQYHKFFRHPSYDNISYLVGKTLKDIRESDTENAIIFTTTEDEVYAMIHHQDCCEHVSIEDICGDLQDLVGEPLLQAEQIDSDPPKIERDYEPESETWTFYKLATIKGSVTIRWYGTSNGYYSESVTFERVE